MLQLFSIKFNSLKNRLRNLGTGQWLKLLAGISAGILFLYMLQVGFYRLLVYVQSFQLIGSLLILKFLGIAFLVTFIMVIFSSITVSFSTLFFSDDLKLLVGLPIKPWKVFLVKSFDTTFQSSWMMIVTLIPFLVAFARVKAVGLNFFVVFGVLSVPFFFIGVAAGIMLSSAVMYFFPTSKSRDIILLAAVAIGSVAYVGLRFFEPEKLANPDAFYTAMQYMAYLDAPVAKYLPSWWFTRVLNAVLLNDNKVLFINSSLVLSVSVLFLLILVFLSEKLYYPIITNIQASLRNKKISITKSINKSSLTMLNKDIVIFFRDTKQWSQVLLVFALVAVYLFSVYKIPLSFAGKDYPVSYISNFLAFFNMGAAGFILAALALRFVFPQISLESGTMWLVFSVPVSIEKFFLKKFVISIIPMMFLGFVMGILSNKFLKVSSAYVFWFSSASIVLLAFGLMCLALGFGALYPKFDTDNVAQIESSYGGILYMVCALLYVGLTLAIWARPMQILIKYQLGGHLHPNVLLLYGIDLLLLNFVVIFFPIWRGIKALKRYELREWSY